MRVEGLNERFRVWVWESELFEIEGFGFGLRVEGLRFRVWGLHLRDDDEVLARVWA